MLENDKNQLTLKLNLNVCTFSRWGQGRGARLGVAEEHLLVKASQSMVGGMGVLLDKDVTGWHNVHHYHFNCHSTGEQKLRRQMKRDKLLVFQKMASTIQSAFPIAKTTHTTPPPNARCNALANKTNSCSLH